MGAAILRQRVAALLLLLASPACASNCTNGTANTDGSCCHGEAYRISLAVAPPNGSVAGVALDPQPVVLLLDAQGRLVCRDGGGVIVEAAYDQTAYAPDGKPFVQAVEASATATNGTATFFGKDVRVAGTLRMRFNVIDPAELVTALGERGALVSPPFHVSASAPALLRLVVAPAGGLQCAPFALQPRLELKDAYNNTVSNSSVTDDYVVDATLQAASAAALTGSATVPLAAGAAQYGELGVDTAGSGYALRFALRFNGTGSHALGAVTRHLTRT